MSYADWKARLAQGNAFDDADVACCYAHRPPYAPALYTRLLELVPHRNQLADLGCGPGKVTANLAPYFEHTLGVDPAGAMIAEAKRLHPSASIKWQHAGAEDAALPDRIDLVTAGTAIHWMRHDVLFPRLADRTNLVAVLNIGAPPDARWAGEEQKLMTAWLGRIDLTYDTGAFQKKNQAYETWLDIAGRETFPAPFSQTIEGFIENMHSTATFSRSRMGSELAAQFAGDLRAMLTPHARDGSISRETVSTLVWGVPRRYARSTET